jgi:hypothetical protein
LSDERDKQKGFEKAFSSLKLGSNQSYGNNKGSQYKARPSWQGQERRPTNWSSNGSNNYGSNQNYRNEANPNGLFNPQNRHGGSSHGAVKPKCNVCQKYHFGTCRYKGKTRCSRCNQFGHNAKDCNNYKPVANLAQEEEDVSTATMYYACHAASIEDENVWFVDSACSNHMTSQESKLIDLDKEITCKVKMGSGDLVQATGKGTLVVDTSQGRRYIEEVLLVPGLDENLLSVGQMIEEGYYILFGGNKAVVFEDGSLKNVLAKVLMKGNRCFPLSLETLLPAARRASVVEESWIWHKRLGHLNTDSMQKMQQKKLVIGLPTLTNMDAVCEACVMGKHKREKFPKEGSWRASKPLELIHTDLCGPMQLESSGGNKYFIIFVDDYARMCWVYFLKFKSGALNVFKKFQVFVELQSDFKIQKLRSDRGVSTLPLIFRISVNNKEWKDS